jgi:HK97 family phage major capsid protein/HK97 family phage prohead protease
MQNSMTRTVTIDQSRADDAARTVAATLSTEYAVSRHHGDEILLHEPDAVDLSRSPLPLVVSHDTNALPIGLVDQIRIEDRKLKGQIRFGESERAREIWKDVQAGVLRNLSIGYTIDETETDGDDFIAIRWTPYEVSAVSIGADPDAGIGRKLETKRNVKMENIEVKETRSERRKAKSEDSDELFRVKEIAAIGKNHSQPELANQAIVEGWHLERFRGALLEKVATRGPSPEASVVLGMNSREINGFSLTRAINAQMSGDWRHAGLEREAIEAAADFYGKSTERIILPPELMRRDFTKSGTSSATIQTDVLAGSFIDLLRNASLMMDRVTTLNGLVGDVAVPRLTAGSTAYWVGEGSDVTESTPTVDQVSLSPNTVGALVDVSRKMLLQSTPAAETLIRSDLALTLATEVDRAIINGSGSSNQPTGILNTSSIGDVAGGTNGLAPTWNHLVELISDVAVANADSAGVFVTNAAVEAKLRKTAKVSSTDSVMILDESGRVAGREMLISNQVPSTLTKGTSSSVCSAIIYGDLRQVLLAEWGSLEIDVDQSTNFASGTVRVRALWDIDVAVRHAEAFSAMQDALTS